MIVLIICVSISFVVGVTVGALLVTTERNKSTKKEWAIA